MEEIIEEEEEEKEEEDGEKGDKKESFLLDVKFWFFGSVFVRERIYKGDKESLSE
jgi:hypothetical protein